MPSPFVVDIPLYGPGDFPMPQLESRTYVADQLAAAGASAEERQQEAAVKEALRKLNLRAGAFGSKSGTGPWTIENGGNGFGGMAGMTPLLLLGGAGLLAWWYFR